MHKPIDLKKQVLEDVNPTILIPRLDGSWAYYPVSPMHPGYVLTHDQAIQAWAARKGKIKSSTFWPLAIVGSTWVANSAQSSSDYRMVVYGICAYLIFHWLIVSPAIYARNLTSVFGELSAPSHRFPKDYYLLASALKFPLVISGFAICICIVVVAFTINEKLLTQPANLAADEIAGLVFVILIMVLCFCIFSLIFLTSIKFYRRHNRFPSENDLRPIDESTGRMSFN